MTCQSSIPEYPSSTLEFVHSGKITGNWDASTPVKMAVFPGDIEPGADDYHPAQWDVTRGTAKILMGAGSALGTLTEGLYGLWVKPVTADEEPVIPSGTIRIT